MSCDCLNVVVSVSNFISTTVTVPKLSAVVCTCLVPSAPTVTTSAFSTGFSSGFN